MRKVWKAVLGCAASIGLVQTAQAAVLYSTGFNSPLYANGVLNAPSPTTDTTTAGQDGWLNSSGGGTNNIQVSNVATDGKVSLTTSGQDVRRPFDGGATATFGSAYYEADITVSAAQATGDYALHFTDGGTSNFYARTFIKSSGTGFVMGLTTSSVVAPITVGYGTTVLDFGTTYHILARYDLIPFGGNDTGALFVNPSTADGSGDTPYVAATTTGVDATTIGALALRQGVGTNSATLTVDNYRAFAVPEPGSMALLGVAGFALFRRRRSTVA